MVSQRCAAQQQQQQQQQTSERTEAYSEFTCDGPTEFPTKHDHHYGLI